MTWGWISLIRFEGSPGCDGRRSSPQILPMGKHDPHAHEAEQKVARLAAFLLSVSLLFIRSAARSPSDDVGVGSDHDRSPSVFLGKLFTNFTAR